MSTLLNLYGFVDDAVFLTKSGDLGVVLAVRGVDYGCLDAEQRAAVTTRFEVALRLWDEQTRLYQYVIKRRLNAAADATHPHPGVDALLRRRHAFLADRQRELYAMTLYLVVLAERRPDTESWLPRARRALREPLASVRDWSSTTRTVVRLDADLERRRLQLRHKVDAFILQLADAVGPRLLPKAEAFTFFRRLVNYTPAKADGVRLRSDTFLDYDVCDSALECHRTHLRLDDDYVRVLTLKEPPAHTLPLLFQALYEIPSSLILASEWQREHQGAVRREIHAKRRHFHNAKVSLATYVTDSTATPTDLLVDDSAAAVVRDLGACLTELTLNGRYFGHYTMTVVLSDRDPVTLERSVGACLKAFAAHDAQVTDERYNLLNAWLAVLPGNSAYNVRSMHLLNTNYADLSLLFGHDAGAEANAHLGREALAVLDSPYGTPYHLNLHVEDVGHTLVLGATGSGKSFLLNFLIAHLQRYSPRTLIFDLGGSYDALTRYFGGRALHITLDRPGVTINPFCLPPTPTNLHFVFAFVKVLMQAGGQYTLTRADDQALFEQIETAVRARRRSAPPVHARQHSSAGARPAAPTLGAGRTVRRRLRSRRGHGHARPLSLRGLRGVGRRAARPRAAPVLPPAPRDGDRGRPGPGRHAEGLCARRGLALPAGSDDSGLRHRGAQDVAEEERVRTPGDAIRRRPRTVGPPARRD